MHAVLALCLVLAGDAVTLEFVPDAGKTGAVEVRGLAPDQLDRLQEAAEAGKWSDLLAVRVATADSEQVPAMLGTYEVEDDVLRFTPRFPLRPGLTYDLRFDATGVEGLRNLKSLTRSITLPEAPPSDPTTVAHVYPTRVLLPENQLKFYLHFTAPMSQGDSYRYLHLLREDGTEVELPFLELGEELWDATGTRLTVFLDPGRIKRGLKPREEAGPVFEEGQSYTLVIDADWLDAAGRPLASEHRKPIRIAPPDDRQPDTARWQIDPPRAGTEAPLTVRFDEPLDHAMLRRVVQVIGPEGQEVAGEITIDREETRWRFVPSRPWHSGDYALRIETTLEDLAGNSLGRPFELDIFHPVERKTAEESIRVPFEVHP